MADADAQAVELAVADQAHGVAPAVLATVAAVELQPRHAGWQVEFVVRQQGLPRLDLPAPHRCPHRLPPGVLECPLLQQPNHSPDYFQIGIATLGALSCTICVIS